MTNERMTEMYEKFAAVAGGPEHQGTPILGGTLIDRMVKLEVTISEVLISLGIAKDVQEAELFLGALVSGRLVAFIADGMPAEGATEVYYDLVKTGFHLGLLAGKIQKDGGAN